MPRLVEVAQVLPGAAATVTARQRGLYPSRSLRFIRSWLVTRYPDKDPNLIGLAVIQIDGLVRDMMWGEQRGSVTAMLKRIKNTICKPHMYAKAWAAMPPDGLALIEQVRGAVEWNITTTGATGFPIPAASEVAPFIDAAIRLAAIGKMPRWRRDRTVKEIAIYFERITGSSRYSSEFKVLLDRLERHYSTPDFQLRFGVQNSDRAAAKIFSI
jgi:hypothetical protein